MTSLDDVQRRLEALFQGPCERGLFAKLWGTRQEPAEVQSQALSGLFEQLHRGAPVEATRRELRAATLELSRNLNAIEALAEERSHPPFAYITWLWRVVEVLRSVTSELSAEPGGFLGVSAVEVKSALVVLPTPLAPLPSGERLQGFALQPLLDMAARETRILSRRRRLLEAARRTLLESSAALSLPSVAVEPRMLEITRGIQQITAWQQAGLDPEQDVSHQLRRAVQTRDAANVEAWLSIAAELATAQSGQLRAAARFYAARNGVRRELGGAPAAPSLEQVSERVFGKTAGSAVLRGCERARRELDAPASHGVELVQAGSTVDACFELGRSVAPVRALEEQRRMAVVPFPTQTLVLDPATTVAELANSRIDDPRLVLYQLATRSLLTRRYLARRVQQRSVPGRYLEARYYLLDGSASMSGRRGRLRDAILLAELASMIRHLETGTATARPLVYYRYFTKHAEAAIKVESIEEALACIEAVLLRKSRGETDIQSALIDSFRQVALERERDANLKRAQIVLVSDGIASVDLNAVWRARQAISGIPVRVSIIALGAENPALQQLAASQRARGEAIFYHYVSDIAMSEITRRTRVARPPPPARPSLESVPAAAAAAPTPTKPAASELPPAAKGSEVWRELDDLIDELTLLRSPPEPELLEQAPYLEAAYEELGVSLAEQGLEAERARSDALRRDAHAVSCRFNRWFPDLLATTREQGPEPPLELLEVIEIVLLSVAELTDYLASGPLGRSVDAIELLEHLLLEAGVSPWAYVRALPHATPRSRAALLMLRRVAGS